MSATREVQLAAGIERDQRELAAVVAALRERVRSELDLREHVLRRPSAWLLGAALFGLWLGARK